MKILISIITVIYFSVRAQSFIIHDTHAHGLAGIAGGSFYDALSGSYNPASLGKIDAPDFAFFYTNYFPEHTLIAGGIAFPLKGYGGISIGYFRNSIIDGEQGDVTFRTHYINIGYGREIFKNLHVGINGIYYKLMFLNLSNYPDFTEQAEALDFALFYSSFTSVFILDNVSVGIIGKHLLQVYDEEALLKETRFIAEKKVDISRSVITLLFNYRYGQPVATGWEEDFIYGLDYAYQQFYLSTGYCTSNKYIAFGGGVYISKFTLGYSYGKFNYQSDNFSPHHTLSFTVHL